MISVQITLESISEGKNPDNDVNSTQDTSIWPIPFVMLLPVFLNTGNMTNGNYYENILHIHRPDMKYFTMAGLKHLKFPWRPKSFSAVQFVLLTSPDWATQAKVSVVAKLEELS